MRVTRHRKPFSAPGEATELWHGGQPLIVVAQHDTPFGEIRILKTRHSASLIYEHRGFPQSEADRFGISLASYVHALFGLTLQTRAKSILLIGCAGGSLATMLVRAGRVVTAVDVNPASFPLAKLYFGLPEQVACHVADGKAFLEAHETIFDVIVLDAYQGDRFPPHFQTLAFLELVRSRLEPAHGALFANIDVPPNDADRADRLAKLMALVWSDALILDRPGTAGNAILAAGATEALRAPGLLLPPLKGAGHIAWDLEAMRFRRGTLARPHER